MENALGEGGGSYTERPCKKKRGKGDQRKAGLAREGVKTSRDQT